MADFEVYTVTPAQVLAFKALLEKDQDCQLQGDEVGGTLLVHTPVGQVHLAYDCGPLSPSNLAEDQLKVSIVSKPMFVTTAAIFAKISGLIAEVQTAPQESATQ